MGDEAIAVQRLSEELIIEMARGIVLNERYVYPVEALDVGAALFFVFIRFGDGEAENVGWVVGESRKATRQMNGHPVCMSGWLVHKDDVDSVKEKIAQYEEALGFAGQDLEAKT